MSRRYFIWLTLALLTFTAGIPRPSRSRLSAQARPVEPVYEVYAISYGIIDGFSVSGLVEGADKSRKIDIQMMVWLLKGQGGRNVLVDSGFYRDKFFKQWKIRDYVKPSEVIAKLGLKPEEISDIIISHVHWDHAGGVDLFPKARVWIQKDEYNYYCDPAKPVTGMDPEDKAVFIRLQKEGRLNLVDGGDRLILPGITIYTGGRHTYASQYVGVKTKASTVVVASDNLYLYENLEKRLPIAATFDADSNLKAQDRMKTIASSPRLIVPGHDREVFVRFPNPGNGVARIE